LSLQSSDDLFQRVWLENLTYKRQLLIKTWVRINLLGKVAKNGREHRVVSGAEDQVVKRIQDVILA